MGLILNYLRWDCGGKGFLLCLNSKFDLVAAEKATPTLQFTKDSAEATIHIAFNFLSNTQSPEHIGDHC